MEKKEDDSFETQSFWWPCKESRLLMALQDFLAIAFHKIMKGNG